MYLSGNSKQKNIIPEGPTNNENTYEKRLTRVTSETEDVPEIHDKISAKDLLLCMHFNIE